MQLNKGTVCLPYENSGGFKDNLGNYGNLYCYGKIKTREEVAINLKLYARLLTKTEISGWMNLLDQKQRWLMVLVRP